MDVTLMSPSELASELGARVKRERLRQNLTQPTLAARAGVSRMTIARMEANGEGVLLVNFLSVLTALRRSHDLENLLAAPVAATIDQFAGQQPTRQRGSR
jgi:transcriptional regulator with XRE-family HTH domain